MGRTMLSGGVGRLARVRPTNRVELWCWIAAVLGVRVPQGASCPGHRSPMDYLEHAFFERPGDAVVWANRGGGKTYYGAVATLLDLLFKPGIEVRVLGGSMDQSMRMYGYLRTMLERPGLRQMVSGKLTRRGVRLVNGSAVELLAQSETSVRGSRVQKLRCDEVELFDPDVWRAAQFVTRSARCGSIHVRGAVEVFSTMHRNGGLMSGLVGAGEFRISDLGLRIGEVAPTPAGHAAASASDASVNPKSEIRNPQSPREVFNWCVMDVMDVCEAERACGTCALWNECGGVAKGWKAGRGFVSVADAVVQKERSSAAAWEAEMMCARASAATAVYGGFDRAVHVGEFEADPSLTWIGGVDFGIRDPFVMVWAQLRPIGGGRVRVEVIDEHARRDWTVQRHLVEMTDRGWPTPSWIGADPSGANRSAQTGRSEIDELRRAGHVVRADRVALARGIELVRRRIEPAVGEPTLAVHRRCERLIGALEGYRFDELDVQRQNPLKDGQDHAADALRYMIVNLDREGARVKRGNYMKGGGG